MIGTILLGLWLGPTIIGTPIIQIIGMIKERTLYWFPFDDWYDIFIIAFGLACWPILIWVAILDYKDQRKRKLTEVKHAIDIHYKDLWYE